MMKIERSLQINMAVLVTLSTALLSMGQKNLVFPLLVSCAAVTSVYFTDTVRWFRLNRFVANGAAVIGVIFSLKGYLHFDGKSNLLAVANLLICLQIILLYQQKSIRTYWYLVVLSLLQVVVAAALNMGLAFGVLLAIYVVSAISVMVLFFVHRETVLFEIRARREKEARGGERPDLDVKTSPSDSRRKSLSAGSYAYQDCEQNALVRSMFEGRFFGHVAVIGVMILVFTVVFFFSTPRNSNSNWHGTATRQVMTTGVAKSVVLPTDGRIQESDKPVMRVVFYDEATPEPYAVSGDIFFRGVVLTDYHPSNFSWTPTFNHRSRRTRPLTKAASRDNVVRQEIVIEPHGDSMLYGVFPAFGLKETPKAVCLDLNSGGLRFASGRNSRFRRPFRYTIGTTAFHQSSQSKVTANIKLPNNPSNYEFLEQEQARLTNFDVDRLANLAALAQQIISESNIDPADHVAVAETLEEHFLSSGDYSYSLDLGIVSRDRSIDPIEDFVVNHRTGHCEYFAGALILMLRSQGLPARMVIGYKGGEFNSVGKYYQVRQRHAHAWVEVFIEPSQAKKILRPEQDSSAGAWYRLDPTTGASAIAGESSDLGLWKTMDDTVEYAQLLWNDYVVGLDFERQQNSLFNPFSDSAILSPDAETIRKWKSALERVSSSIGSLVSNFRWDYWLSWRGVMAIIAILFATAGFRRFSRIWPRSNRFRGIMKRRSRQIGPVEFYERLVDLLARAGICRDFNQTQREFASSAATSLAYLDGSNELIALPRQIVDAFYRVRFGGDRLKDDELEAIETALTHLQSALANKKHRKLLLAKTG